MGALRSLWPLGRKQDLGESMSTDSESSPRRILVLGTLIPSPDVRSARWDNIPTGLNVADYDTVILDFSPFEHAATAQSINIDTLPPYPQFARLLFTESSEIIVIGRPFFRLGRNPFLQATWFLPVEPDFLDEPGETLEVADPQYSDYLRQVASWSFCLQGWAAPHAAYLSSYMSAAGIHFPVQIRPRVYPIAENRYDRPVAFTFKLTVETEGGGTVGDSAYVTWLPPTTEIPVQESIILLLRSRFGILQLDAPPEWLSEYSLPAELPLRRKIENIESQVGNLVDQLDRFKTQLAISQRPKQILFQTGEHVLEPVVIEVLCALGASAELPKTKGKEDARITDPSGRLATIEIKGRSGPLRLADVRQAHQWVADRIAFEGTSSKGILIANLVKDIPPRKRGPLFPDNCRDAARNLHISLVSTTQLFAALALHQEARLDVKHFWDVLFIADGPADMPDLH